MAPSDSKDMQLRRLRSSFFSSRHQVPVAHLRASDLLNRQCAAGLSGTARLNSLSMRSTTCGDAPLPDLFKKIACTGRACDVGPRSWRMEEETNTGHGSGGIKLTDGSIWLRKGTTPPIHTQCVSRFRFPCEPGSLDALAIEIKGIAGLMRPPTLSLPRRPPWPAPFAT